MVNEMKIKMPNTKIFVSDILPKMGTIFNNGLQRLNNKLYYASKNMGFKVINHFQFCVDGKIVDNFYARDQIHLSRGGVARLGCNFKYMLKKFA